MSNLKDIDQVEEKKKIFQNTFIVVLWLEIFVLMLSLELTSEKEVWEQIFPIICLILIFLVGIPSIIYLIRDIKKYLRKKKEGLNEATPEASKLKESTSHYLKDKYHNFFLLTYCSGIFIIGISFSVAGILFFELNPNSRLFEYSMIFQYVIIILGIIMCILAMITFFQLKEKK